MTTMLELSFHWEPIARRKDENWKCSVPTKIASCSREVWLELSHFSPLLKYFPRSKGELSNRESMRYCVRTLGPFNFFAPWKASKGSRFVSLDETAKTVEWGKRMHCANNYAFVPKFPSLKGHFEIIAAIWMRSHQKEKPSLMGRKLLCNHQTQNFSIQLSFLHGGYPRGKKVKIK